ncbi:MAG: MFS transporter [Chlorobi bacterium]|nr:MFS transporter [Chlorobiota bacterium]
MSKHKASLAVIFLTVFIDLLGFGILIPILPTFASNVIGISDFGIGIIVASYSLMQFIFNPIIGKISDRIGRRPVILISLITTIISYIIFSFSTTFIVLLSTRLLAGIGGSNVGAAQAYIADITDKSNRAKGMGIIGAAFGLGFVFGPIFGGIIAEFGYEYVGFASAGFSSMAFLFALFFLPESLKVKKPLKGFDYSLIKKDDLLEIKNTPNVAFFIALFFIIIFAVANIYGTFALLGQKHYGFTDRENGYLFGIIGIVGAIVQGAFLKRMEKFISDKSLIIIGLIFLMVSLGLLPYGINFTGVAIISGLLAIGTGILQPMILSIISKYSPQASQGRILGLNQSIASMARVLGPLWGGFAFQYLGYEWPFITGAVFTFFTLIITIYFLNSDKKKIVSNV